MPTPWPQPWPSTTRSAAWALAGSRATSAAVRIASRIAVPNNGGWRRLRCHHRPISSPVPTAAGEPAPRQERRVGSRLSWLGLVVSLLAVAGVVWWASQAGPAATCRRAGSELAALLGAIALYALATVVRAERWQRLLVDEGAHARAARLLRADRRRLRGQQRPPRARRRRGPRRADGPARRHHRSAPSSARCWPSGCSTSPCSSCCSSSSATACSARSAAASVEVIGLVAARGWRSPCSARLPRRAPQRSSCSTSSRRCCPPRWPARPPRRSMLLR